MPETSERVLGEELDALLRESRAHWNLSPPRLVEEAVRRNEAALAMHGPLVASTGEHTGRSPKDRFIVRHPASEGDVSWGPVNQEFDAGHFDGLLEKARGYLGSHESFVVDGYAGADPRYRLAVRIVTEKAWHSLFARNMFLREERPEALASFAPDFRVVALPGLEADPSADGTRSSTFVLLDLDRRLALIGGTEYAGEIKKSIFSVMNYYLPQQGVLSMHCSANYGANRDDVALFFGLSGTGKTTLSADPDRILVGDDEHGWSDTGIFNIEGGCYAKVIRLSAEGEPMIYSTTRRFGTVLENVVYDPVTRCLDLDDDSLTENTRASYPIDFLERVDPSGVAGHPRTIVFLTCDAFGVLPPIARLDEHQAMYHFLSGYTAKVAGTERGVDEPQATFSTCFGAPFMPLRPAVYARMLGEKIARQGAAVWLVNTGWTGGPFGTGERIALGHTRRLVRAALSGELDGAETQRDEIFGLASPMAVEGVPAEILRPRQTWADAEAFDSQAGRLADMFHRNIARFSEVPEAVRRAGPLR